MIPSFLQMIRAHPEYLDPNKRAVFVVVNFEIEENRSLPERKSSVVQNLDKSVFPFARHVCSRCHEVPGFDDWVKSEATGQRLPTTSSRN